MGQKLNGLCPAHLELRLMGTKDNKPTAEKVGER